MSIFYASKVVTDSLVAQIDANYQTYLSLIETASGMELKSINTVKVGADYQAKGMMRPFILIDPQRMDVDDEAMGIVRADYTYTVLIAYDGFAEEDAVTAVQLYADAFISMVISDDYFTSTVDHASVTGVEYYPGSSVQTRYAVLDLVITLDIER